MSEKPETNSRQQFKVCGLTRPDQIRELTGLEIDFLGFIFYRASPRFVLNHLSLDEISKIDHPGKVGVFVNESIENIFDISEKAHLNFIQLHGDETKDFIIELKNRLKDNIGIIKVIRIGNPSSEELQTIISVQPSVISYLLFDTDSKAFGGTGKTFDWKILKDVEIPFPYFLSGGISLENMNELNSFIEEIPGNKNLTDKKPPFAFDINSKFETEPGNKDVEKIKKFISHFKSQTGTV